jgi:hypothetical protein
VSLRLFACWDWGFESRMGPGYLSLVIVVCFQVEVSATGRSPFQRSPTEFGVSECDREVSIMVSNTMERKDRVFSISVNTRCKT